MMVPLTTPASEFQVTRSPTSNRLSILYLLQLRGLDFRQRADHPTAAVYREKKAAADSESTQGRASIFDLRTTVCS
jgi:hypothetical protein